LWQFLLKKLFFGYIFQKKGICNIPFSLISHLCENSNTNKSLPQMVFGAGGLQFAFNVRLIQHFVPNMDGG
jgi:hypothetical protein